MYANDQNYGIFMGPWSFTLASRRRIRPWRCSDNCMSSLFVGARVVSGTQKILTLDDLSLIVWCLGCTKTIHGVCKKKKYVFNFLRKTIDSKLSYRHLQSILWRDMNEKKIKYMFVFWVLRHRNEDRHACMDIIRFSGSSYEKKMFWTNITEKKNWRKKTDKNFQKPNCY